MEQKALAPQNAEAFLWPLYFLYLMRSFKALPQRCAELAAGSKTYEQDSVSFSRNEKALVP
jgi:hypothetical protein